MLKRPQQTMTRHAWDRLKERFPDYEESHLAHEVVVAVKQGEFEVVGQAYHGQELARIEFANVTVYVILGHGNQVVSVFAPGMVVFTPWGKLRLPYDDTNPLRLETSHAHQIRS
jgi:hypothetical protein